MHNVSNKPWTVKEYKAAIEMRKKGCSYQQVAYQLERSLNSVHHALRPSSLIRKRLLSDGFESFDDTTQLSRVEPRISGTSTQIEAESVTENITSLEELINACRIDLTKWEVERWTANTWTIGAKDSDGNIVAKNMYQVKAVLKKIALTREAVEQLFRDSIRDCKFDFKFSCPKNSSSEKVLEISIPDLHLGKLAWEEETGHENYDSQKAIEVFRGAIQDFLSRTPGVSEIILPIGNDYFNVNNKQNTTAHGTPQDEDSRWQKSFRKGYQLAVWAINECSKIAKVKVVIISGNHDTERTFYLGECLNAFFSENSYVTIDNAPTQRKYCVVGNTLIGFTHGDRIKLKDLTRIAQIEQRDAWGKTKYCEWHLGHLHRESTIEEGGVVARVIPSLSPPDAWHSTSGYVTSNRGAQAFLYDKNKGLECIYYYRV
jgi:hypothetical protein